MEVDGTSIANAERATVQQSANLHVERGGEPPERAGSGVRVTILDVRNGRLIQSANSVGELLLRETLGLAERVESVRQSDERRFASGPDCVLGKRLASILTNGLDVGHTAILVVYSPHRAIHS